MNVHKTEINIEIVPNCFKLHPSFQNPIFKHRRRRYRERIKLICWNSFEHHIVRQRGPHELQTNINKKNLNLISLWISNDLKWNIHTAKSLQV